MFISFIISRKDTALCGIFQEKPTFFLRKTLQLYTSDK